MTCRRSALNNTSSRRTNEARVGDGRGATLAATGRPSAKWAVRCYIYSGAARSVNEVDCVRALNQLQGRRPTEPMGVPMSIQRAERELVALQQEMDRLDVQIGEARSRAVKLGHYIEMAREFDDGGSAVATTVGSNAYKATATNDTRQRTPQGGMSGRAVRECIAMLREHGRPIQTGRLYELIQQRGVRLGGKNPAQALSGYLSRTPGLTADRSVGWSLEEWQQPQGSTGDDLRESGIIPPQARVIGEGDTAVPEREARDELFH